MTGHSKKGDKSKILLDSADANIRKVGGCSVQTIPRRWTKRFDLRGFLGSPKLKIELIKENGVPHIEIRIVENEEEN